MRFALGLLVVGAACGLPAAGTAQEPSAAPEVTPAPAPVIGYAFAKASPLPVFARPDAELGEDQDFEFGKAYDVIERTAGHVRLRLPSGGEGYLRLSHILLVPSPSWVASTSVFRLKDRNRIRLWESSTRLNDFLGGLDTAQSRWDYEELFGSAPDFQLRLPIFAEDTLELLGGTRQVNLAGVLVPISRKVSEGFAELAGGRDTTLRLHFLVDVSGSTRDFLERAVADILAAIGRIDAVRDKVTLTTVTTFGSSARTKASFVGKVSLDNLRTRRWHPSGNDTETDGDDEPLVEGLGTLAVGLGSVKEEAGGSGIPVLIVLSGADVGSSGQLPGRSTRASVENVPLGLKDASALFVQITPEPGTSLEEASRRLPGVASPQYFGFSASPGNTIASRLRTIVEGRAEASIEPEVFLPLTEAAIRDKMIVLLPREITGETRLPRPQAYAEGADWYTVPLWLAIDQTILKRED